MPLCHALGKLSSRLNELEIGEPLLDSMQRWECLRQCDVEKLLKTEEAKKLDKLLEILNGRGPSKWYYLVCVFLEVGHDELAKRTWEAVREDLELMRKIKNPTEAMDLWDEFVRRMLKELVLNQREGCKQTAAGPVLASLGKKQQQTASELWGHIVKYPVEIRYFDAWKILINAMNNSRLQTAPDTWKEQVDGLMRVLKAGERDRCRLMCEYLLQQAKPTNVPELMIEFMLDVHAGPQKPFLKEVIDVLMEHVRQLLKTGHPKLAENMFRLLVGSIGRFVEKDASQEAIRLNKTLCDEIPRLPKQMGKYCLVLLYDEVRELDEEEEADKSTLEALRAALPHRDIQARPQTERDGQQSGFQLSRFQPAVRRYRFSQSSNNLALVINNMDFENDDKGEKRRHGSNMDGLALPTLLGTLGFHVIQRKNLTKDSLLQEIKAFAQRPEHEHADAAVLMVMTHGGNEALEGSDHEMLSFQAVIDCFSDENAPNLAGKPKWIGFHACRIHDDDGNHANDDDCGAGGDTGASEMEGEQGRVTLADLFITHTAFPGGEALRDLIQGTWYVQALKHILLDSPEGRQLSLFEIHMEAQTILSGMWTNRGQKEVDGRTKPTLEVRAIGWSKKLCFDSDSS